MKSARRSSRKTSSCLAISRSSTGGVQLNPPIGVEIPVSRFASCLPLRLARLDLLIPCAPGRTCCALLGPKASIGPRGSSVNLTTRFRPRVALRKARPYFAPRLRRVLRRQWPHFALALPLALRKTPYFALRLPACPVTRGTAPEPQGLSRRWMVPPQYLDKASDRF